MVEQNLGEDRVTGLLGAGKDGIVFLTSRSTAVKINQYDDRHANEREAYLRLDEHQILDLNGVNVPRLIYFNDALK